MDQGIFLAHFVCQGGNCACSKTRRNRLRSRAAGFLLSWGGFLGRRLREARMSVAQARGIVKGLKWRHLGFCFFWAVTFVALMAPADEFAFASTSFSVGKATFEPSLPS